MTARPAMAVAEDRPTMTVMEVAALLGVNRTTVYDQVNRGNIPHLRIGRKLVFPRAAVMAWFESAGKVWPAQVNHAR